MRKCMDLWITDCLTGEIKVIQDFDLCPRLLFLHIKPYFDNQRAIKLEIITNKFARVDKFL